jgi:hypothetical protein
MKRIVLVAIGVMLLSIGAVDWLVGALMPHSRFLMIIGGIAVAVAGFLHRWQKLQFSLLGVIVSPLEQALTPPDRWPMVQRSGAPSALETWSYVFIFALIIGLCYYLISRFLRFCK